MDETKKGFMQNIGDLSFKKIDEANEIALRQKREEEERIKEENRRIKEWEEKFDLEQKKREEALIEKFYSDTSGSSNQNKEEFDQKTKLETTEKEKDENNNI